MAARCDNYNGCEFYLSLKWKYYGNQYVVRIPKVSRTDSFDMETKWTCGYCEEGQATACEKLEIYGKYLLTPT